MDLPNWEGSSPPYLTKIKLVKFLCKQDQLKFISRNGFVHSMIHQIRFMREGVLLAEMVQGKCARSLTPGMIDIDIGCHIIYSCWYQYLN